MTTQRKFVTDTMWVPGTPDHSVQMADADEFDRGQWRGSRKRKKVGEPATDLHMDKPKRVHPGGEGSPLFALSPVRNRGTSETLAMATRNRPIHELGDIELVQEFRSIAQQVGQMNDMQVTDYRKINEYRERLRELREEVRSRHDNRSFVIGVLDSMRPVNKAFGKQKPDQGPKSKPIKASGHGFSGGKKRYSYPQDKTKAKKKPAGGSKAPQGGQDEAEAPLHHAPAQEVITKLGLVPEQLQTLQKLATEVPFNKWLAKVRAKIGTKLVNADVLPQDLEDLYRYLHDLHDATQPG